MIVRRLSSELYHHGIKGQRWGVRRYQNADGSLTRAGREKYTTGNSKGVHRRGEALNTGPAGEKAKKQLNHNKRYENLYSIDNFNYVVDPSLKSNQIGCKKKKDPKTGKTSFDMTFKSQDDFNKWQKAMGYDELDYENDKDCQYFQSTMDYTIGMLEKHGELNFDLNSGSYNPDLPLSMYTNLSGEEILLPSLAYNNREDEELDPGPSAITDANGAIIDLRPDLIKRKLKVLGAYLVQNLLDTKMFRVTPLEVAKYGAMAPQMKVGKAILDSIVQTIGNHSGVVYPKDQQYISKKRK